MIVEGIQTNNLAFLPLATIISEGLGMYLFSKAAPGQLGLAVSWPVKAMTAFASKSSTLFTSVVSFSHIAWVNFFWQFDSPLYKYSTPTYKIKYFLKEPSTKPTTSEHGLQAAIVAVKAGPQFRCKHTKHQQPQ